MENRSDQSSVDDYERRESAESVSRLMWVFGPDPDLTYDSKNGWTLDQFAALYAPTQFQEYKSSRKLEYPTPLQYPFL